MRKLHLYTYVDKVDHFLNQAHTWFIEIAFIWEVGMRVCLSLYVRPSGLSKTIHIKWKSE